MPTYGEKCLSDFESALKALDDLAKEPYEPSDVRDVLSTLGAQTELFLCQVADRLPVAILNPNFDLL